MAREPLRLTASVLAAHRSGALVACAVGSAAGIPERQARYPRVGVRATARAQLGRIALARFEAGRGYSVLPAAAGAAGGGSSAPAPGTAVVQIRGVIEQRADAWSCGETTGYDIIEADIIEALCDPGVGSVVIDCDSPGGDVPGMAEATARIRRVANDVAKPVIGFANEMVASAALYLVLGVADALYAPRYGRVGSISSACIFMSESRALVKEGLDVYIARGLPGKMKPNGAEPLDEIGKRRLDELALSCSEDFIAFVAACRAGHQNAPSVETIRSWSAEVFMGQAAFEAGLVDGIGSLEETIALAETWPRAEAA